MSDKAREIKDRDYWAFRVQDDNPLNVADEITKALEAKDAEIERLKSKLGGIVDINGKDICAWRNCAEIQQQRIKVLEEALKGKIQIDESKAFKWMCEKQMYTPVEVMQETEMALYEEIKKALEPLQSVPKKG